jgi:glycosyltransferase involved in cell wall biosynthesis
MIRAFGVVVPAHNEENLLDACLDALASAARQGGVPPVRIVVVADSCTDATADAARARGVEVLEVQLGNTGASRAVGLDLLVKSAEVPMEQLWLCTTDADSVVPDHWFLHQARKEALGYDAVVGTVVVDDWSGHSARAQRRYARHYGHAGEGHLHVHGANLGLSGEAYQTIGGFPPLSLAEDHALVAELVRHNLQICRTGNAPVVTSARRDWRAPDGFGALLNSMDDPEWERTIQSHS